MTLPRARVRPAPVPLRRFPRLLALPGLGLTEHAWRPTLEALPQTHRAVRLPGYGLPAGPREDLSPRRLAELVVDVALPRSGPAVLLAHSVSCQVAAHVAALVPDLVATVVLVGPTTDPRAATWPRLVRDWVDTARREEPGQLPGLVAQYRRSRPTSMRRAMSAARHDRIEQVVGRLACPVLVLRGPEDRVCTSAWADQLVRCAPHGSAAVTLEQGAHMVPSTHGPLVAAAVRDWLAAHPDSSAVASRSRAG